MTLVTLLMCINSAIFVLQIYKLLCTRSGRGFGFLSVLIDKRLFSIENNEVSDNRIRDYE